MDDKPIGSTTTNNLSEGDKMNLMEWFDGQISELQEAKGQYEVDLKAERDAGYVEGKASVVLPDASSEEKLFTQADMDRLAQVAKEEQAAVMQPAIDGLAAQVNELNAKVEALVAEKDLAVADVKAAMVEKFKAFKAAGDQSEDAFLAEI